MHATRLSRGHLIRFLPAMATGTLPERHKLVHLGQAEDRHRRVAHELLDGTAVPFEDRA